MECSAKKKKYTLWSEKEIRYLKDNYKDVPVKKMSETLGRPVNSIYAIANMMGLKKSQVHRPNDIKNWTEEEEMYLRENLNYISIRELSEILNRSEGAIYARTKLLGLKCKRKTNYLNFKAVERSRKNNNHKITDSQSDTTMGLIDAYKGLAMGIVRVSLDDLQKDIYALKRIVDRGLKKDRVKEAVKKVLISEATLFNDNFQLYLEADAKKLVLRCWYKCNVDRDKYLKENLWLVEEHLDKEFVE